MSKMSSSQCQRLQRMNGPYAWRLQDSETQGLNTTSNKATFRVFTFTSESKTTKLAVRLPWGRRVGWFWGGNNPPSPRAVHFLDPALP